MGGSLWHHSDFVDCAEHLVSEEITSPKRLAVCGRSAGGLLIGNVVNMRPDLFAAAVADVPFVDLMNSVRALSRWRQRGLRLPLFDYEREKVNNTEGWYYYYIYISINVIIDT